MCSITNVCLCTLCLQWNIAVCVSEGWPSNLLTYLHPLVPLRNQFTSTLLHKIVRNYFLTLYCGSSQLFLYIFIRKSGCNMVVSHIILNASEETLSGLLRRWLLFHFLVLVRVFFVLRVVVLLRSALGQFLPVLSVDQAAFQKRLEGIIEFGKCLQEMTA